MGENELSAAENRNKAQGRWKILDLYLEYLATQDNKELIVSSRRSMGVSVRRAYVEALKGRGRNHAPWFAYVHAELLA